MEQIKGNNPGIDLSITFIYFNDVPKAMEFYENIMGFQMVIDQGWVKIYQTSANGCVGLVDGARGFHKASETKPIILCFRVPDVDQWYEFIKAKGVEITHDIKTNSELMIRAFLFRDPEGHTIEVQTAV
jgi:lactoylglutathione lyase